MMDFRIREIQICGQSGYVFTDDRQPVFTLCTEGGLADRVEIEVRHGDAVDWQAKEKSGMYFTYAGKELLPCESYIVTITAQKGETASRARAAFDTGMLGKAWKSSWIEPVQEDAVQEERIRFYQIFSPEMQKVNSEDRLRPAQELQKTVILEKEPEKAVLYATAHGVYELTVNGKRADERRLPPEISVYPRRMYYQRYDLAGLLHKGENEITVTLADGWWCGRIGLSGDSCQYGSRLGFLAQMEYVVNGEKRWLLTDESWRCRPSYIVYADLYIGEKWNLTETPGSWRSCETVPFGTENLCAQELAPVQTVQELKGRLFRTPGGELLADFGQTVAGVVKLKADSSGKKTIVLEHCEVLDKNGEFFRNIVGRNKQQRDTCICDRWPVVFCPKFTYHGFRYVRISGIQEEEIQDISAEVIGSPLHFHGDFSCSDDRLNRLQQNIRWSMRGNFISIPTDCPQREKMGWTGDIQVFTPTACFNADVNGFLQSWLANMRCEQRESGEIPNYIPAFPVNDRMQREGFHTGDNTSAAWGDACILVPLYLYNATGDSSVLKDNLPMMERWLGFIRQALNQVPEDYESFPEDKKERYRYLWLSGHHFGDWLIPSFMEQPDGTRRGMEATCHVVSSAFYAVTLRAFEQVLSILLREKENSIWRKRSEEIRRELRHVKKAVCEEYINPDGMIRGDLQGLYVIVLYAGIAEGELRKKVAAQLASRILENGTRLDTGFVTTPYLLQTLCDNGYRDLAYKLLFQTKQPSWLYQVEQGATTIWENWNAVRSDGEVTNSSMNHYALGSVGEWIYRHIGGIAVSGMSEIHFAPDTGREITWSRAETMLPCGRVFCSWERNNGEIRMRVGSPLPAAVTLEGERASLAPGRYTIVKRGGGAPMEIKADK